MRIGTLDGWRACAIALVIVCHSLPDCNPAWLGKLGVDIFFGLSGFLITALLLAERERTGAIDLAAFYKRRAFRILPPALTFLAVVGIAGLFKTQLELFSTLLFWRNYLPIQHGSYATAHLWSLAIEEQFYLLWPGLLALGLGLGISRSQVHTNIPPNPNRKSGKKGQRMQTPLDVQVAKSLHATITAVSAVAWPAYNPTRFMESRLAFLRRWIGYAAFAIALWRLYATSAPWADIAGVNLLQRTDLRLDSLLWGCAVAFLWSTARHKLAGISRLACLAMAGAVLLPYAARADSAWAPLLVIAAVLAPLVIPFILAATALHPEWLVSRILELPVLAWVGRLSYSLYLWQEVFLVEGLKTPSLALNLALTLAAACASYYLIERPLIRLGRAKAFPAFLTDRPSAPMASCCVGRTGFPGETCGSAASLE